MTRRRLLTGCALGLAVLALVWTGAPPPRGAGAARPLAPPPAAARPAPAPVSPAAAQPPAPASAHPDIFYDDLLFHQGLREVPALPPASGWLAGGVVPHHNLAAGMLTAFFLELEHDPPATLVVIGPNHENRGQRVITGRLPYATAFGLVETDPEIVDRLVEAGLATLDEAALDPEHSIGALMPYLKHHAPKARVVPIIVHPDLSRTETGNLAAFLAPLVRSGRVMLVGSVDFSHYLTRPEAEAKDEETLAAIRSADLPTLWRMGPDHLDSPPSLAAVMLAMAQAGAAGPDLAGHTNSGVLVGSDETETTSYFVFKYWLRGSGPS